jgi:hypothetical protein
MNELNRQTIGQGIITLVNNTNTFVSVANDSFSVSCSGLSFESHFTRILYDHILHTLLDLLKAFHVLLSLVLVRVASLLMSCVVSFASLCM